MQVHRDFGVSFALGTVDLPFEIGPQDQPSAGIVTFTTRVSELGGIVLVASGQPAFGATVIVFPDDERLWTPVTRRIQAGLRAKADTSSEVF